MFKRGLLEPRIVERGILARKTLERKFSCRAGRTEGASKNGRKSRDVGKTKHG